MNEEVLKSITSVYNILIKQINISSIVYIIIQALGLAILLYLTWYGIRKLIFVVKTGLIGGDFLSFEDNMKARRWYKKEGYKYYSSYNDYVSEYNMKHGLKHGNLL